MALDKAALKAAVLALTTADPGTTADSAAEDLADAIEGYVTAALVNVTIPAGAVITSVTGGSGAPAVGVANVNPIALTGDPEAAPGSDTEGGLS